MIVENLDTLVFAGGGVRGLSYVGFLMAFQDTFHKTANEHFKTFAGTSVGALFALLCAIGCDVNKILEKFEKNLHVLFEKDPTCLVTHFALNTGAALQSMIVTMLESKGVPTTVTMHELYKITNKKLVVTVVDIQSANVLYLDHLNEGRDLPLLKVIMGSMALPPIFPFSPHGLMSFVDGGLLDNFPLKIFDPEKTLGVSTAWYIDPSNPTQDICSFYTRILSIVQIPIHKEQVELFKLYKNRVFIDLGNVNADNTSVDTKSLIFQGYRTSITRFAADGPTPNVHGPLRFLNA